MSTTQTNKPLPAPTGHGRPDEQDRGPSGFVTFIVSLFALIAWAGAFALISSADEQDVPATNYALGIALTIVGATLILAVVIYDSVRS
jgi:hypothetical protein